MAHGFKSAACLLAAAFACVSHAGTAQAGTFKTIYSFCVNDVCAGGRYPRSALVQSGVGTYYGTTWSGGLTNPRCNTDGCGTIFRMKRRKVEVLHLFCQLTNCADGSSPSSKLIVDVSGNLYGVAGAGGTVYNSGTVFELKRNGKLVTLYRFCRKAGCPDGAGPTGLTYQGAQSGAPYDGVSPLYGVTNLGGANGVGALFELQPGSGHWKETVLHNFCDDHPVCSDGSQPVGVVADTSGTLYGATSEPNGAIFKFQDATFTTLHNFCSEANCTDGQSPTAPPALDGSGNLFGVASEGGNANQGVIYEIDASGAYTKLWDFCAEGQPCANGAAPDAAPYIDADGNLFGATQAGGGNHDGVIYELSGSNYRKLHDFCVNEKFCVDGLPPVSTLIPDGKGHLFGVTMAGGLSKTYSGGSIFQITP